jgi:glycosyltransferase involved in cell wall biosynthesis
VSVLMPAFNAAPTLAEAVESILRQTWRDFELIVVDDASTDETAAMLRAYAKQDDRIVLLHNESNQGYTVALNRGLALARGRYIARQDADDISLPERLARQVEYLEAHPAVGVLATAIALLSGAGEVRRERYFDKLLTNEALQHELLVFYCIGHGSVMMRTACLRQVGGYDPAMEPAEDHDLWLRLAEVTELAALPDPLYQYRTHAASVSHRRRSEQVLHLAEAIENAVRRRNPQAQAGAALQPAATAFLRASIAAATAGDLEAASERAAHAQRLDADILMADEPLAGLLQDHTASWTAADGEALYETLFGAVLPKQRRLARLKARLVADLHMREVFAGSRQHDRRRVRAHLWRGVWANPAWLLNRGVLAIAGRLVLGRGSEPRR